MHATVINHGDRQYRVRSGFNIVAAVIFFSAVITVGYVQTAVTVLESDGVAQLTVGISMPPGADPIETSFLLLVNTSDGTGTGLHTHKHVHTTRTLVLAGLEFKETKTHSLVMVGMETPLMTSSSNSLEATM